MSMDSPSKIDQIDTLLPQTQCNLCGYGGCKPYATAIIEQGAPIDKCPPGDVDTLNKLAKLTQTDPTPLLADFIKTVKKPAIATIEEAACIGCTKCIQACPVDAIIGAAKVMHTVITTECTGCELCVAPCPVDCIDIKPIPSPFYQKDKAKTRFSLRTERLAALARDKQKRFAKAAVKQQPLVDAMQIKRDYIQTVLAKKRQQGQTTPNDP